MDKILIVVMLALTFSACKKQETYCGVEDPVNDIEWIGKIISSGATELRIFKNTYKGAEGFYVYSCINGCSVYSIYYKNCDNILIYQSSSGGAGGSNFPNDFSLTSSYRELIYSRE